LFLLTTDSSVKKQHGRYPEVDLGGSGHAPVDLGGSGHALVDLGGSGHALVDLGGSGHAPVDFLGLNLKVVFEGSTRKDQVLSDNSLLEYDRLNISYTVLTVVILGAFLPVSTMKKYTI
jgi:hypothetical protein